MERLAMHRQMVLCSLLVMGSVRFASSQTSSLALEPLNVHPVDRVLTVVDDNQRVVLSGNRHPLARVKNDLGAAPPGRRMDDMILVLLPDQQQQNMLDELAVAQQNPASTYYHRWLTPESYTLYFGISYNDRQQVEIWLMSHGLQVNEIAPGGQSILFSGTVAQVEDAFHTEIHAYQIDGELHYANATDPELPVALKPVVDGVVSLHDFRSQPVHTRDRQLSDNTVSLTLSDFATRYNLAPLYASGINGAGESIAVAGRTNIDLLDVQQFRASFGLPVNQPEILVNEADPGRLGLEDETRAILDVEWAGAVAQSASIKYVVSGSTGATDGTLLSAKYIVGHNLAPVMSVSFDLCEAALGASANHFLNSLWEQAALQGITVIVSSSNDEPDGCNDPSHTQVAKRQSVNGIASTPYDLSVIGTDLHRVAGYGVDAEPPATTGGESAIYAKPWWQYRDGTPDGAHRAVPDVTFASEDQDVYPILLNGSFEVAEGNAFASACFAGIMAMVVQSTGARQGNAAPILNSLAIRQELYGGASELHKPEVIGNNVSGSYEAIIGIGSVNAYSVVTHWADSRNGAESVALNISRWPGVIKRTVLPLAALLSPLALRAQTPVAAPPPVLFYSDIDSGPATGGEGGKDGAFVCVYGEHFGATQGSSQVIVGATAAAAYKVWRDPGAPYLPGHYAKACVQLSHRAPKGMQTIQLTTSQGASNTLPFNVRTGNVYFATPSGSDKNSGSSSAPFATLQKCKNALSPGDICYLHAMTDIALDSYASLWLNTSGTAGNPKAIVAYPGETVTLDATVNHIGRAMFNYVRGGYVSYWTIAGLTFIGYNVGVDFTSGTDFRLVDNDITAPGANTAGAMSAGLAGGGTPAQPLDTIAIYGNRTHDVGCGDPGDAAHYFNYASSPHPCGWTPAGKVSSSGTTVTQSVFSTGTQLPDVIKATNPANGQVQIRRLAVSATQPCAETKRGGFPCSSWNGKTQKFTIDQPFSPDLPSGTQLYFRFYAPAKTEHNVYFSAYTYHLDFGWNEIDGNQGRACRGFQIFHDAIPNNHDLLIHDNYIHDIVCDGINMNAFDATCGPVKIYNNLIVNTGQGVSDIIADLPGGGANYSAIYMSGSGTILPWLAEKSAIKSVGQPGTTQYSYAPVALFNGFYIIGPTSTTRTGNSSLNEVNYNTILLPALPHGASSWSIIRRMGGDSIGMVASGLAGESTFSDKGLSGDGKSYAQAGMCLASSGEPLYPDQLMVYNNTIVNGGVVTNAAGMQWPGSNEEIGRFYDFHDFTTKLVLSNNIIIQPSGSGVPYWKAYQPSTANVVGTNNLCNGIGACPSAFTASETGDPKFVDQAGRDFHIQSGSAAIATTSRPLAPLDLDGLVRNSPYAAGSYAAHIGASK